MTWQCKLFLFRPIWVQKARACFLYPNWSKKIIIIQTNLGTESTGVLSVPTVTKYREDKKSRLANLGTESTLPNRDERLQLIIDLKIFSCCLHRLEKRKNEISKKIKQPLVTRQCVWIILNDHMDLGPSVDRSWLFEWYKQRRILAPNQKP